MCYYTGSIFTYFYEYWNSIFYILLDYSSALFHKCKRFSTHCLENLISHCNPLFDHAWANIPMVSRFMPAAGLLFPGLLHFNIFKFPGQGPAGVPPCRGDFSLAIREKVCYDAVSFR